MKMLPTNEGQNSHCIRLVLLIAILGCMALVVSLSGPPRLASAQSADPQWLYTGNLKTARFGHTATLLNNGMVLAVGGHNYNQAGPFGINSAELYDPATVRLVAEHSTLGQQEFNRAFVLMQYFGYLRRNPNDAPEATLDFSGYNFWLNKLNSFNGDFIAAEMVKAFLSSSEYRRRFGP